jgi:hypothetical protein
MKTAAKKTLGTLAITLSLLLALTLLSGCGIGRILSDSNRSNDAACSASSADAQDPATSDTSDASLAGDQGGLPATFSAYGNSYRITSYTIETNDDGNTVVVCEGSGFDVLPMRNGAFQMPVSCTLIVDGNEESWTSGSAGGSGLEFEFDGKFEPSAVIFTAGDDDSQRVECIPSVRI